MMRFMTPFLRWRLFHQKLMTCKGRFYSGVTFKWPDLAEINARNNNFAKESQGSDSTLLDEQAEDPSSVKELSLLDVKRLAHGRNLEELLPVMMTFIQRGQLDTAEVLVRYMKKTVEWAEHRNAGLANAFLQAYLSMDLLEQAKKWKDMIFSRKSISPDTMTFSILFKFYLERNETSGIKELANEMSIEGIDFNLIARTRYLDEHQIEQLQKTLNAPRIMAEDSVQIGDNLLKDFVPEFLPKVPLGDLKAGEREKLPAVTSIPSKSDGILFLKDALKGLQSDSTATLYSIQEKLERDCFQAAAQKSRTSIESFQTATKSQVLTVSLKNLFVQWQPLLKEAISYYLKNDGKAVPGQELFRDFITSKGNGTMYSTLMSLLDPDRIAFIVLQELIKASSFDAGLGGALVNKLADKIGQNVEREVFAAQASKREFLDYFGIEASTLERAFRDRRLFEQTMRAQYAALERNTEAIKAGWIPKWAKSVRFEVGAYLISIAISKLKYGKIEPQPAFHHRLVRQRERYYGVITPCAPLSRLLTMDTASAMFIEPWAMPMLVPPKPWLTTTSGGYLTQRTLCVRVKDDPLHVAMIEQADKSGSMQNMLIGLDVLGRTPWIINERVLKVALELWNQGVNVATMETYRAKDKSTITYEYRSKDSFATHEAYIKYVKDAVADRQHRGEAHSTMCDTNYKLEIARQFIGITFYLPHSVDFRGRAYPIPPHLSHIGSDLSRGLMLFAEGKALGGRGLRWLKIQLSNMAGFDKASLDEREEYAEKHRADVMDSADHPLTGRKWWKTAEEPWQCLAICIELTAAWRSTNPAEFISHIPCQQDGSCNGLQHYAALGRDVDGATKVNLSPGPKPADVYSAVAELVATKIKEDAERAMEIGDSSHIASKLVGKINRKIVKQTVMTNVYGVTLYGARAQVEERLKEYKVVEAADMDAARKYIAQLVFKSLGTLFEKAQQIQEWLTDAAAEIAKAIPPEVANKFGIALSQDGGDNNSTVTVCKESDLDPADRYPQTSVAWTNPLGFQVLQPYNRQKKIQLRTVLQSITLRVSSKFDPVDIGKQSSAFPPNFVHSLDATHMFMTAIACYDANITFASVHDCFWTHASTVDKMGELLREQFVKLYNEPILEQLAEEFRGKYRGYVVPRGRIDRVGHDTDIRYWRVKEGFRPIYIRPVPSKGDFDINQVLNSTYFFS